MSKDKKINEETKEIIDSFVSEGYDLLEDAEGKIVNLECVNNKELVNTIFRMFHSIKGSAGFLNFENIKQVTHEAENLLDIFRKENVEPSQEAIDLLYQTLDFLRQVIINVEQELTDEGFEEPAALIINNITDCVKNLQTDIAKTTGEENTKNTAKLLNEHFITQEMRENFFSEASESFDVIEHTLLELEKDTTNKELVSEIFRKVHTLKGNCGLFNYENIEVLCIDIESMLDKVRQGKLLIGVKGINKLLAKIDLMRNMLLEGKKTKITDKKTPPLPPRTESKEEDEDKMLGELLVEMGEVNENAIDKALALQEKNALGEILVELGETSEEAVKEALKKQKRTIKDTTFTDINIHKKDIRVDTNKLDNLFDIVGELITAGAMVINNQDLEGLKLDNFNKAAGAFVKITHDLQEITMSMRMVQLENLFTKMKRLVRDLSRKSNKEVHLHISGQETEMDRTVIEQISDPLVHLIRNAIDHGIEDVIDRNLNKKPESGNIYLNAKYEGNEIWITVEDDGKGLNREKILNKAHERGLLTEVSEKMSDEDIWKIIFEPGFSTARIVSDISGRGVGMDVVKKNIEKLRGKIDIYSEPKKGTKFILKIPLTLAIIEGITVKVGSNLYSIPTTDIQEFFELRDEQSITTTDHGNQVIMLRNEIIPLIKLYEAFKVKTDKITVMDGIIIVLTSNNKKICILVDEVIGNHQIVVKSLSGYLGDVLGISGCTIMGNGEVSLIIDTTGLINEHID